MAVRAVCVVAVLLVIVLGLIVGIEHAELYPFDNKTSGSSGSRISFEVKSGDGGAVRIRTGAVRVRTATEATELVVVQSGECGDWNGGCTSAKDANECQAWSDSLGYRLQFVVSDTGPVGCSIHRSTPSERSGEAEADGEDEIEEEPTFDVEFRGDSNEKGGSKKKKKSKKSKERSCSREARCICRCKKGLDVALYTYKGASRRGKVNIPLVLEAEEWVDGAPLQPIRVHEFSKREDWLELEYEGEGSGGIDVVVIPGGGASRMIKALGPSGLRAVRRFVRAGGGYVGICAGYYLASVLSWVRFVWAYSGALHISPRTQPGKPHGLRGDGNATAALTPFGAKVLRRFGVDERILGPSNREQFFYANGPVYKPRKEGKHEWVKVLLEFTSQVPTNAGAKMKKKIKKGDSGVGFGAVVANTYGKGTVVLSSPHPETSPLDFRRLRGPASAPGTPLAVLLQAMVRFVSNGQRANGELPNAPESTLKPDDSDGDESA